MVTCRIDAVMVDEIVGRIRSCSVACPADSRWLHRDEHCERQCQEYYNCFLASPATTTIDYTTVAIDTTTTTVHPAPHWSHSKTTIALVTAIVVLVVAATLFPLVYCKLKSRRRKATGTRKACWEYCFERCSKGSKKLIDESSPTTEPASATDDKPNTTSALLSGCNVNRYPVAATTTCTVNRYCSNESISFPDLSAICTQPRNTPLAGNNTQLHRIERDRGINSGTTTAIEQQHPHHHLTHSTTSPPPPPSHHHEGTTLLAQPSHTSTTPLPHRIIPASSTTASQWQQSYSSIGRPPSLYSITSTDYGTSSIDHSSVPSLKKWQYIPESLKNQLYSIQNVINICLLQQGAMMIEYRGTSIGEARRTISSETELEDDDYLVRLVMPSSGTGEQDAQGRPVQPSSAAVDDAQLRTREEHSVPAHSHHSSHQHREPSCADETHRRHEQQTQDEAHQENRQRTVQNVPSQEHVRNYPMSNFRVVDDLTGHSSNDSGVMCSRQMSEDRLSAPVEQSTAPEEQSTAPEEQSTAPEEQSTAPEEHFIVPESPTFTPKRRDHPLVHATLTNIQADARKHEDMPVEMNIAITSFHSSIDSGTGTDMSYGVYGNVNA